MQPLRLSTYRSSALGTPSSLAAARDAIRPAAATATVATTRAFMIGSYARARCRPDLLRHRRCLQCPMLAIALALAGAVLLWLPAFRFRIDAATCAAWPALVPGA